MATGFEAVRVLKAFVAGSALATILVAGPTVNAQPMPVETVKMILESTAKNWLAFRNYNGRQLVYFTQVLSWHCGLTEIRYSINNNLVEKRFPVPKCNPQLPNRIPSDQKVYLELDPDTVNSVAVQLMFSDGTASNTHVLGPCDNVGGATCAVLLQSVKALTGSGSQGKGRPSQ